MIKSPAVSILILLVCALSLTETTEALSSSKKITSLKLRRFGHPKSDRHGHGHGGIASIIIPATAPHNAGIELGMTNNDAHLFSTRGGSGTSKLSITQTIKKQWKSRIRADPDFQNKSIAEVMIAIATQLAAEINRRGMNGMMVEIDFVVAGILTAMAGKYYTMWRVAPTATLDDDEEAASEMSKKSKKAVSTSSSSSIPTNAFQTDKPYTIFQRGAAFITPIPSLFQAGFVASIIGYGFTSILIALRSLFIPTYQAATANVNLLHASIYTGAFMAIISNIRYQILQGIIEPGIIEKVFGRFPAVKGMLIVVVRLANGLLGSTLAIAGMKLCGLQKLK